MPRPPRRPGVRRGRVVTALALCACAALVAIHLVVYAVPDTRLAAGEAVGEGGRIVGRYGVPSLDGQGHRRGGRSHHADDRGEYGHGHQRTGSYGRRHAEPSFAWPSTSQRQQARADRYNL